MRGLGIGPVSWERWGPAGSGGAQRATAPRWAKAMETARRSGVRVEIVHAVVGSSGSFTGTTTTPSMPPRMSTQPPGGKILAASGAGLVTRQRDRFAEQADVDMGAAGTQRRAVDDEARRQPDEAGHDGHCDREPDGE